MELAQVSVEHPGGMLMMGEQVAPGGGKMEEAMRRERKKWRNRMASMKCRRKKLDREAMMELRVKQMQDHNMHMR